MKYSTAVSSSRRKSRKVCAIQRDAAAAATGRRGSMSSNRSLLAGSHVLISNV